MDGGHVSPCGCQSACGCTVSGERGVSVRRVGDTFFVSLGTAVHETFAASGVIDPATTIAVFDGAPGSTLELPPALEGMILEVWNIDVDDDLVVAAAAGETVNSLADVDVAARYTGRFISIVDGEWLANVY